MYLCVSKFYVCIQKKNHGEKSIMCMNKSAQYGQFMVASRGICILKMGLFFNCLCQNPSNFKLKYAQIFKIPIDFLNFIRKSIVINI